MENTIGPRKDQFFSSVSLFFGFKSERKVRNWRFCKHLIHWKSSEPSSVHTRDNTLISEFSFSSSTLRNIYCLSCSSWLRKTWRSESHLLVSLEHAVMNSGWIADRKSLVLVGRRIVASSRSLNVVVLFRKSHKSRVWLLFIVSSFVRWNWGCVRNSSSSCVFQAWVRSLISLFGLTTGWMLKT